MHGNTGTSRRDRRTFALAAGVLVVVLGFLGTCLTTDAGSEFFLRAVDNLGQLALALTAALAAARAARRSTGRERRCWTWTTVGTGGWAGGQAVWSLYELVLRHESPFPSLADAGYLIFPVGATAALWLFPAAGGTGGRRQRLLDGLTIACALLLVSCSTTLGEVVQKGAGDPFQLSVSLAYPLGDVVVLTMAVLTVIRSSRDRRTLALLATGMIAMAVSDSAFTYLTAVGRYSTGDTIDLGWLSAFALITLAALAPRASGRDAAGAEPPVQAGYTFLPYLVLAGAALVVLGLQLSGRDQSAAVPVLAGVSGTLVLLRQYFTLRDNRTLVTAVAASEAELRHRVLHDGLTGLANRTLFIDRVGHALELHARDLRSLGVLFYDLDDFKVVNDTLGHAAGDQLLVRVADRLLGALRPGDTLARLGGDEFALLLEDGGDPVTVAGRVLETLRLPFTVADRSIRVQASIGIAIVSPDAATPSVDELLSNADVAMYTAKRAGKGVLRVYQPGMALSEAGDLELRPALAEAVAARLVRTAYQPIVTVATGRLAGFEALARWSHDGREISPVEFIPLAERAGLVSDLTDLMLDRSCRQLASWSATAGHRRLQVNVNVSPQQINDPDFPARVQAALSRTAIDPGQLVLEITESALLTDLDSARRVTGALRSLGVRLALDDFGTGYSSLAHLHAIPLTSLKIDRVFIDALDRDSHQRRFARGLLALGRDLDLVVTAEGVERTTQLEELRRLGCPQAQGMLFAAPSAPAAFASLVLGTAAPVRARPALLTATGPMRAGHREVG